MVVRSRDDCGVDTGYLESIYGRSIYHGWFAASACDAIHRFIISSWHGVLLVAGSEVRQKSRQDGVCSFLTDGSRDRGIDQHMHPDEAIVWLPAQSETETQLHCQHMTRGSAVTTRKWKTLRHPAGRELPLVDYAGFSSLLFTVLFGSSEHMKRGGPRRC